MGNDLMPRIVTVGAAVWDVFLRSPAFYVMHDATSITGEAQCVALGTKIESDLLVTASGGGATNAAVTFARLGFQTALVARVGSDDHGRAITHELEREGIDIDRVIVDGSNQTGYSAILMTDNGERSIISFRGVSKTWSAGDIPDSISAEALYVTSLGGDIAVLKTIIDRAGQAKIFLNPGLGEIKKGPELLPLLRHIDTLIVNLEEGRQLLGKNDDLQATARDLLRHTPRVLVTDGPRGALLMGDEASLMVRPSGKPSVSRTGAGDAFGSGFAAAMMKGMREDEALKIATANAESVVSHIGAKVGILRAWPEEKDLAAIRVEKMTITV